MEINYLVAYMGGLLTFLAPCGAFLLPAFFAYAFNSRGTILWKSGIFLLGLLVALLPLGMAAGLVSATLIQHRNKIMVITAIFVGIMGIIQLFNLPLPKLRIPGLQNLSRPGQSNVLAVFLLGISYGLAGAGCTGPILGTILTTATVTGSALKGGLVMFWYALGIFTPIMGLTLIWDGLSVTQKGWLRPRPLRFAGRDNTVGGVITGIFCLILAVWLLWSGGGESISLLTPAAQAALENTVITRLNSSSNWLVLLLLIAILTFVSAIVYYLHNRKQNWDELRANNHPNHQEKLG